MLVDARFIATMVALLLAAIPLSRARSPMPMEFRAYGLIVLLTLAVEIYGHLTLKAHVNNTAVYNGFLLSEYLINLWLLSGLFRKGLLAGLGIAGIAAMAWGLFDRGSWNMLYTESILVLALITIGLIIVALWQLAQRIDRPLQQDPRMWLLVGMLPYFGSLIPMMGVTDLLVNETELATVLWTILPFMGVLRHLFGAYASWRMQADQTQQA